MKKCYIFCVWKQLRPTLGNDYRWVSYKYNLNFESDHFQAKYYRFLKRTRNIWNHISKIQLFPNSNKISKRLVQKRSVLTLSFGGLLKAVAVTRRAKVPRNHHRQTSKEKLLRKFNFAKWVLISSDLPLWLFEVPIMVPKQLMQVPERSKPTAGVSY